MSAPEPLPGSRSDEVTVRSLVTQSWQSAPPMLRGLAVRVWALAFVAAVICVAVDIGGWWGDLAFTTNLVSEIIGSLIAFPLALLIVNQLAAYQVLEAERPRLEARVQTGRQRTLVVVGEMREQIVVIERELVRATDEFVGAVLQTDEGGIDVSLANEAAQTLAGLMNTSEWAVFERTVTPVRLYGLELQTALVERHRNGGTTPEIEELARLSAELQSAISLHRRIMDKGHVLFSRRPAVNPTNRNRQNEMRDAAIEYVKSVDRLLDLCDQMEGYLNGMGPASTPAP